MNQQQILYFPRESWLSKDDKSQKLKSKGNDPVLVKEKNKELFENLIYQCNNIISDIGIKNM
jgi:hypothetical protein